MRKKRIYRFIIYLFLVKTGPAFCQSTTTDVKVSTGPNVNYSEYIAEEINLGEYGYTFKTASPQLPKKQVISIYHYDANLELKWKKEVESSFYPCFPFYEQWDKLISSIDGTMMYNVQMNKKKNLVRQLVNSGQEKSEDLSNYEVTKNLQSVFCDAQYLYYLTTENGDEKHMSKKAEEMLIVHRFSNKDYSYRKTILALPSVEKGKNSSFWSFIGQNKELKFIASKNIDLKTKQHAIKVVAFNSAGDIQHTFTIDFSYPDYDLNESEIISKAHTNLFNLVDLDHSQAYGQKNRTIHNSAYSTLYLDAYHNALYILGVLDSHKKTAFYIHKYALTGDLIWKGIYPTDGVNTFNLNILPDESLNFSYQNKTGLTIHEISNKGEQTSQQDFPLNKNGFFGYDNTIYEGKFITGIVKGKPTHSIQTINGLSPKEKEMDLFSNYVSSKGELLLISNRKGSVKILQFK